MTIGSCFLLGLSDFTWLPLDTWIVVVGGLSALSCALLGCFLVLRKMSMMGDAISHAVLPGLAAAFLITGSRDSVVMLAGAAVVGVLTALFTQWIHSVAKVDQGAAMGVVFTGLFAVGLILIRQAADHVDLDPDCVLYGAIEFVPLNTTTVLGHQIPRAALVAGACFVVNLLVVTLLYKEFKISSFDPALATTLGINATLMHYVLMTLVALTTVAAFESVGSILVIAMLIVPAAAAHLLTERLSLMILVAMALAAASALLGHAAAISVPSWIGYPGASVNTAGMIGVVAGFLFLLALLAAPRHGLLSRGFHGAALSLRIAREDLLGLLFRIEESQRPQAAPALAELRSPAHGGFINRLARMSLRSRRQIHVAAGKAQLTPAGRDAARQLVRAHRLWETYFDRHTQLPPDHLHRPAEQLEHVTTPPLRERLAADVDHPSSDPHGSRIPSD